MPYPLPMRLNPTRSGDLEREREKGELENREAQRELARQQVMRDVRETEGAVCGLFLNLWLQFVDSNASLHPLFLIGGAKLWMRFKGILARISDMWAGANTQGC